MREHMHLPFVLSWMLVGCMAVQALLGRAFPGQYRDPEWIRMTWIGNDWITLVVAVPLLIAGLMLMRRGSIRGVLLWLGLLGYGLYNYAFYLVGAALNAFFPLYITSFLLAVVALILALARLPVAEAAGWFTPGTPVRLVGGYLAAVALGLTFIWMMAWAAYVFDGQPPPGGPEAFQIVAALDITLMVPPLAAGGVLLWRRRPWGYVIASIAGIQGTLYLFILGVNAAVGIARGLEQAPGQLPIWGPLVVATAIATALLLTNVKGLDRA